jgi:ParB family chromosome partitioning protein
VLVVVKDVSPKEAFELALVENIQRADLNPIEVAEAFDRLIREHGYKHESLAERVGKDRTTIVNALRLLKLPARIRSLVISRELSEGHARALLGAPTDKAMADIADKTVRGSCRSGRWSSSCARRRRRSRAPRRTAKRRRRGRPRSRRPGSGIWRRG